MKTMNAVRKYGRQAIVTAGASALMFTTSVYAAVPAEATDAINAAKTDVNAIGWAVFGVIIAAAIFKYIRRAT